MYNYRFISVEDTLSTEVRRALFSLYKMNNSVLSDGTVTKIAETDDLGYPIKVNPSLVKNKLLQILRDMERPEDLDTLIQSMATKPGNE